MSPLIQNLIAMGIGALALGYLLKRWWPSWTAMIKPSTATSGCHNGDTTSSSCGSGCGQCGSANAPARKDHRIQIVKTPPRTH